MADRFSVTNSVNNKVIAKIDSSHFLSLDNDSCDRTDLFMFALALGLEEKKRTPLDSTHGLILESTFGRSHIAMSEVYALMIDSLIGTEEEDHMDDKDLAYTIAQEYANTGFGIIAEWLTDTSEDNEEIIIHELISKMSKKFKEIAE